MKVFKEGEEYTKVELSDGTRTLAYTNEGIYINGALAPSAISFCGSSLALIDGSTSRTRIGSVDERPNRNGRGSRFVYGLL